MNWNAPRYFGKLRTEYRTDDPKKIAKFPTLVPCIIRYSIFSNLHTQKNLVWILLIQTKFGLQLSFPIDLTANGIPFGSIWYHWYQWLLVLFGAIALGNPNLAKINKIQKRFLYVLVLKNGYVFLIFIFWEFNINCGRYYGNRVQ